MAQEFNIPEFSVGEVLTAAKLDMMRQAIMYMLDRVNSAIGNAEQSSGAKAIPVKVGDAVASRAGIFNGRSFAPPVVAKTSGDLEEKMLGEGAVSPSGDDIPDDVEVWDLSQTGHRIGHFGGYNDAGMPVLMVDGSNPIKFGAVTGGDWTSGTTFDLNPCSADGVTTGEPSVAVYAKKDKSSYSMVNSTNVPMDTVVPYVIGSNGDLFVLGDDPSTAMTDFQIDGDTYKFQKKTRDTWGTFHGTESDWVDIITGGACS
jgi:hypothetical protein